LARQAATRLVVQAVRRSAQSPGLPRSEVSLVRRDAAAPSSYSRQVKAMATPSGMARWPALAAAWRPPEVAAAQAMAPSSEMKAAAVVVSARQAAWARLPAGASGAKVQPPGAAVAEVSAPSVRPRVAVAEVWAPSVRLREVAGEAPAPSVRRRGAAAEGLSVRPPAVAEEGPGGRGQLPGAALDAAAEPQPAVAAEELPDAEVPQPAVPVPLARQLAGRPSVPPSWRLGDRLLPWLAPRRSVRSAHTMRRSRVASPSKRSWRAAGCEGLS
jgi:hypothetical protein